MPSIQVAIFRPTDPLVCNSRIFQIFTTGYIDRNGWHRRIPETEPLDWYLFQTTTAPHPPTFVQFLRVVPIVKSVQDSLRRSPKRVRNRLTSQRLASIHSENRTSSNMVAYVAADPTIVTAPCSNCTDHPNVLAWLKKPGKPSFEVTVG